MAGKLLALAIPALLLATTAATTAAKPLASAPLIGANYSHFKSVDCSMDDTGIVRMYGEPGVRRLVRAQLAAMRSAGLVTLRLLLWHMTDVDPQRWGVVPSSGGRLPEPDRSNFIRYLRDIRSAGFVRLTLSFGPMWTNSPFGQPRYVYDPSKLEENWRFIRDVRPLLKEYGPAETRVDLINEAPPSDYTPAEQAPGLRQYVAEIYSRYLKAYGNDDVLVSVIAKGDPSRLTNLIDIIRATGLAFPHWFEIHPSYDAVEALQDLRRADATLRANGLLQPFVVGEEAYDDAAIAQTIAEFMRTSTRPVDELIEWPLEAGSRCENMSVSPPYRADAYIAALTQTAVPPPTPLPLPIPPVPTLRASVAASGKVALTSADGARVTVLDSGAYKVIVRDGSPTAGFRLFGSDLERSTGKRFIGTHVWNLNIGLHAAYGSTFSYRSTGRGMTKTFVIH